MQPSSRTHVRSPWVVLPFVARAASNARPVRCPLERHGDAETTTRSEAQGGGRGRRGRSPLGGQLGSRCSGESRPSLGGPAVRDSERSARLPVASGLGAPMQIGSFVGSLVVVAITGIVSRNMRRAFWLRSLASQLAFWLSKAVKTSVSRGRPADLLANGHLPRAGPRPPICLRAHRRGVLARRGVGAIAPSPVAARRVGRRFVGCVRPRTAGVHLPLDVVGGAGLGLLLGTFARWGLRARRRGPPGLPSELDEVAPLEDVEADPAGEVREPVGRRPVAQRRGDRNARLHPDAGEAGNQRGLERGRARPVSAPRQSPSGASVAATPSRSSAATAASSASCA